MSEGTTSLIKNLLVLQPSKRLTAVDVLDSLSSIIATFRVPSIIRNDEQVVPDIALDEEKEEKKVEYKGEEKNGILLGSSEFSKQMTLEVCNEKFRVLT